MDDLIREHLKEYEAQIAALQSQLAAYEGAKAALQRLLQGDEQGEPPQPTVAP